MTSNLGNLKTARESLELNAMFTSAFDLAKKQDEFKVHITGLEKWNYLTGDALGEPKADGSFDVEGHCWTDIHGYLKLSRKEWAAEWISWFRDVKECWSWQYLASSLKFAAETAPLTPKKEVWIWTVEGTSVLSSDIADEMVTQFYGNHNAEMKAMRNDYAGYAKKREEIYKGISREQVLIKLAQDCLQVNRHLWVQKEDPTVIIVDELSFPFDMKDGWSNSHVLKILKMWLTWLTGSGITFTDKQNVSAVNKTVRSIKMGMLDIERGTATEYSSFDDLLTKGEADEA